jgi:hypothetical protein
MSFAMPMVWREMKDHLTDCYFCLTKTDGHNSKSEHTTVYPNIPSALRTVKYDACLPVPKPPQQWTLHEEELTSTSPEDEPGPSCSCVDSDFPELTVLQLVSQSELNDLPRDLNISKVQAELLVPRLQVWNLLQQGVKVSQNNRQHSLSSLFSKDGELVYWNNVEGFLLEQG